MKFKPKRVKEKIEAIKTDPVKALEYCRTKLRKPWPAAEPYIMKSPKVASAYALNILKHRWPEAEPYIMKDPEAAVPYANILFTQRKWPEAEPYIIKDPLWAHLYATTNKDYKEKWDRIYE